MTTGTHGADQGKRAVRLPVVVVADRRAALVPALTLGGLCIVAGGLVAAASAPSGSEKAVWAAAYLVLVGGVAQIGLGLGQATFAARGSVRTARAHLVAWNAGNALVVAGTLRDLTVLTDLGGVLLLAALGLVAPGLRTPPFALASGSRWLLRAYRAVVALLAISVPVGLLLARR